MFEFSSFTIGLLVGAGMLGIIAVFYAELSGSNDKRKHLN